MGRKVIESERKRDTPWLIGNKINQGREPWNKGKTGIYSDEKKAEMVANKKSNKGIKMPPSFGEQVSLRMKGKIVSPESREKMSKAKRGRKLSEEHAEKLRLSLREKGNMGKKGAESNFWKGGITKASLLIKVSDKYIQWRNAVYERDNYTCQNCGATRKLEAHHIKSFSSIMRTIKLTDPDNVYDTAMNTEHLWDISNGLTLCRPCHAETDNYLVKAKTKEERA